MSSPTWNVRDDEDDRLSLEFVCFCVWWTLLDINNETDVRRCPCAGAWNVEQKTLLNSKHLTEALVSLLSLAIVVRVMFNDVDTMHLSPFFFLAPRHSSQQDFGFVFNFPFFFFFVYNSVVYSGGENRAKKQKRQHRCIALVIIVSLLTNEIGWTTKGNNTSKTHQPVSFGEDLTMFFLPTHHDCFTRFS